MAKLPICSGKEVIKILTKLGYYQTRQHSSHIRLTCLRRKSITVTDYRTISRGLLRKILRDAELTVEEFIKLLR